MQTARRLVKDPGTVKTSKKQFACAYEFRVYSFLYVIKYMIVNDCFCHLCGVILTLNNHGCDTKNHVSLDNRYVVPYNSYLSVKYNAHINVEICSSIISCKYLYKYVYKGPDMASVAVEAENEYTSKDGSKDEISKFVNSRFMTSSEGFWRICGFDVHGRDPSIQRLAVHEENFQLITFNEDNPSQAMSNPKDTTLLAWFKLNQNNPTARQYTYFQIPEYFVWNGTQHRWTT